MAIGGVTEPTRCENKFQNQRASFVNVAPHFLQSKGKCRSRGRQPTMAASASTREKGKQLKQQQEKIQNQNKETIREAEQGQRYKKWEQLAMEPPPPYVPKKTDRIAIVGAGPAGLHMAYILQERNFENVVLIEKEPALGGKSLTQYNYEPGVPQEFGTCYTIPYKYQELRRIAEKLDYTNFEEIPVPERHVFDTYDQRTPITQDEWLVSNKAKKFPFKYFPGYLKTLVSGFALLFDMIGYNRAHNKLFDQGVDELLEDTNMTYKEYLLKNKFEDLIPLFSLANTVQGYGFIDQIPAMYGLWWNSPAEIRGFIATLLRVVEQPASILRHGFLEFWQVLAENVKCDVRESFNIETITRTDDKVTIKGIHEGKETEEEFDFLILTSNLKDALTFLDTRPNEEVLLKGLTERSNLTTTLFSCEHVEDPVPLSSWTSSLLPSNEGRLMTVRNSAKIFNPEIEDNPPERDYLISYQYIAIAKPKAVEYEDELKRILVEDLTAAGYKDITIHEQHVWPYFQHWDLNGVNTMQYPIEIMRRQGDHRTWYAGASCLFESVHDCMEYNKTLMVMLD